MKEFAPNYFVTEDGDIYSKRPSGMLKRKLTKCKNGYLCVVCSINGKKERKRVHRLVLESFVGPRPDGMVTRHLNGVKTDNRLVNLTYGTQLENAADKRRHGTQQEGDEVYNSLFSNEEVNKIKKDFLESNLSVRLFAQQLGIKKGSLMQILLGICYAGVTIDVSDAARQKGESRRPKMRFSKDIIREMIRLCNSGYPRKYVVEKYGVSPSHLSKLVTGVRGGCNHT